nr:hypothetical protein CFP56_13694 [Quercus suber]
MDAIMVKTNSEGIKAKDVYGSTLSGKVWSKLCRENLTKENEDLEARLREEMNSKFAKHEEKFAQKLQAMGTPQQSNIEPVSMISFGKVVVMLASFNGIKAKDVYGSTLSGKVWSKLCRENLTKENEDLEARLREEMNSKFAKHEEKFAQKLQAMGTPQQSNIEPVSMISFGKVVVMLASFNGKESD